MTTFRKISRLLATPLALALFLSFGPLPAAQAAMVSTDQLIERSAAPGDRERVKSFLAREDVRRQMAALGVDADETAARIAGLSDTEAERIANRLDQLPAGQDSTVGPIVGAFVLIFIILLITDLLCFTRVFSFTECAVKK